VYHSLVSRPEKERRVGVPPVYSDFKPTRVAIRHLKPVDLSLDEYEAIRLCDYSGLGHTAAAVRMGVSRSTFTRLHERARQKVARFLVEGLRLSIDGGQVHFRENLYRCKSCMKVFPVEIGMDMSVCPECSSQEVENLAAHHGHGDCCLETEA